MTRWVVLGIVVLLSGSYAMHAQAPDSVEKAIVKIFRSKGFVPMKGIRAQEHSLDSFEEIYKQFRVKRFCFVGKNAKGKLSGARLLVIVECYPDFVSAQNRKELSDQIAGNDSTGRQIRDSIRTHDPALGEYWLVMRKSVRVNAHLVYISTDAAMFTDALEEMTTLVARRFSDGH